MSIPKIQIKDVMIGTENIPTYHENGKFAGYRPPRPFLSAAPFEWHGLKLWTFFSDTDNWEADERYEDLWEPVRFWLMRARLPEYTGNAPYDLHDIAAPYYNFNLWHCKICNKPFMRRYGTKFCSGRCADEHRRRKQREWIARKRGGLAPKPCAQCGSEFTPQRSTAIFCSARCRVAASRRTKA